MSHVLGLGSSVVLFHLIYPAQSAGRISKFASRLPAISASRRITPHPQQGVEEWDWCFGCWPLSLTHSLKRTAAVCLFLRPALWPAVPEKAGPNMRVQTRGSSTSAALRRFGLRNM
ncbi:hypothetical protein B0J12DRAFT_151667 [Macrophomina phaseolina]|uniref:Secreted protein n=1 Tax=Macrophomina phaseolina TaxID=35725 RepID=A0ABQ8G518_9PEZI|nr:hypothetical protein B0J12DRAFT_151667 [Macrophomina phaseolina]